MAKLSTVGCVLLLSGLPAAAGIVTYSDRTTFNSQGTIVYNSNFDDFGSGFAYPSNPFTRGGVTYTSGANLTVGSGSPYSIGDTQTVMSYDEWSPITGTISTSPDAFSLFGFDAAVTSGTVDVTVFTNLSSYTYSGLTIADGSTGFTFLGYKTTSPGEYFTSFEIDTLGSGHLPGMTNVALGGALASAPEPASWFLLIGGLGALAMFKRRKSATVAVN